MEAGRGSRTVCFAPDGAPWCPLKYNELILSIIVHSMPIAEELAGVDMRLEAGAIRFVACFVRSTNSFGLTPLIIESCIGTMPQK